MHSFHKENRWVDALTNHASSRTDNFHLLENFPGPLLFLFFFRIFPLMLLVHELLSFK